MVVVSLRVILKFIRHTRDAIHSPDDPERYNQYMRQNYRIGIIIVEIPRCAEHRIVPFKNIHMQSKI
jgi:hypothetical protein